jgi:hypothetical protein
MEMRFELRATKPTCVCPTCRRQTFAFPWGRLLGDPRAVWLCDSGHMTTAPLIIAEGRQKAHDVERACTSPGCGLPFDLV